MRLISTIFLLLVAVGCDDAAKEAASSAAAGPESSFQGVIRGKQWVQTPLNTAEVTYTIGADQIRRETKLSNVLDKVVEQLTGATVAGIICKPKQNEVILYCTDGRKKHYCKMTLEEYRENCAAMSLSSRDVYRGFGQIYLDVPEAKERTEQNTADHSTVEGYKCDRHLLNFGEHVQVVIETDHARQLHVSRELLVLVEPNLPDAVTGFPLRVRRAETLRDLDQVNTEADERWKRWLAKAAKLASKGLKKAMESGLDVQKIEPSTPGEGAFDLPSDYTLLDSIHQMKAEFYVSDSDWDD